MNNILALGRRGFFGVFAALALTPAITFAQDSVVDTVVAPQGDLFIGSAEAPVTIIEYASFTCSHCANFNNTVKPELEAYIDEGKVRLAIREVYFDRFGLLVGMIAHEVSNNGTDPEAYFDFADRVFETQSEWIGDGEGVGVLQRIKDLAIEYGMTGEQVDVILDNEELGQRLFEKSQALINADDIMGTPTFLINGQQFTNMHWPDLKEKIDGLL